MENKKGKDIIDTVQRILDKEPNARFCVDCWDKLAITKEGKHYCSNEMCLNDNW